MFLSSSKQKPDNEVTQIGALLRRSREARSENLDDIAAELLIDPAILGALEEGRVKDLPCWARVIGALRSYAGHLELDATPLVVRYRKILAEPAGYAATPARNTAPAPDHAPPPAKEAPSMASGESPARPPAPSRNRTPRGLVFFITLFIAIAVMAGIYLSSSPAPLTDIQPVSDRLKAMLDRTIGAAGNDAPAKEQDNAEIHTETKPLPGLAAPVRTAEEKTTATGRANNAVPPQAASLADTAGNSVSIKPVDRLTQSRTAAAGRLTLRATAPVWVSITDANGASIMTREMKPGDMFLVPDQGGLLMEVRDAGAVEYFIDGTLAGRLGKRGEALSGLELDKSIRQKAGG